MILNIYFSLYTRKEQRMALRNSSETGGEGTEAGEASLTKRGLKYCYNPNNQFEIGVDEAGRGPMFGRVYAAAVILPLSHDKLDYDQLRDSKKIKSMKTMSKIVEQILSAAIAYAVCYEDEDSIDKINIRQATHKAMKRAIHETFQQLQSFPRSTKERKNNPTIYPFLLIDGNDFTPFTIFNTDSNTIQQLPHTTIEGGDNKYTSIAAASILAKYERDSYIDQLCEQYPLLKERYSIHTNKGYGTKTHLDGIKEYGITKWHRKTYGICREYSAKLNEKSNKNNQ